MVAPCLGWVGSRGSASFRLLAQDMLVWAFERVHSLRHTPRELASLNATKSAKQILGVSGWLCRETKRSANFLPAALLENKHAWLWLKNYGAPNALGKGTHDQHLRPSWCQTHLPGLHVLRKLDLAQASPTGFRKMS